MTDQVEAARQACDRVLAILDARLQRLKASPSSNERLEGVKEIRAIIDPALEELAVMRREMAIELYEEKGYSAVQVAHALGVSRVRAYELIKGNQKARSRKRRAGLTYLPDPPTPVLAEIEIGERWPDTALYRFWDVSQSLLYVGIAEDPKERFGAHRFDKAWWGEVSRITVVWYGSRTDALAAETIAINTEHPKYNIAGVIKTPPTLPV